MKYLTFSESGLYFGHLDGVERRIVVIKRFVVFFSLCFLLLQSAHSHCQVPCGIYYDEARVAMMNEHAQTIIKSIESIKSEDINNARNVRWVITRDHHADKIVNLVCDYFLLQRVKKTDDNYDSLLKALHAIMLAAISVKQNPTSDAATSLVNKINVFSNLYFKPTSDPWE